MSWRPRRLRAHWYLNSDGDVVGGGMMPADVREFHDVVSVIHARWWVWRGLIYLMKTKKKGL